MRNRLCYESLAGAQGRTAVAGSTGFLVRLVASPETLFNDLVGTGNHGRRQINLRRFGGFQVDDEFEHCRLLDRYFGNRRADAGREAAARLPAGGPVCLAPGGSG